MNWIKRGMGIFINVNCRMIITITSGKIALSTSDILVFRLLRIAIYSHYSNLEKRKKGTPDEAFYLVRFTHVKFTVLADI